MIWYIYTHLLGPLGADNKEARQKWYPCFFVSHGSEVIDPALYLTLWWSHMLGRFHHIKTVICWYGCCWWRGNVLGVDGDGEDMKNNIKVTTMMKQIDKNNQRGDRDESVIRMMLQWMMRNDANHCLDDNAAEIAA